MLLPLVPKLLDFQASFLAGQGIGRYGSAQFSDVVINPITGKLDPINETEILLGLVAHPTDRLIFLAMRARSRRREKTSWAHGGFGTAAFATTALSRGYYSAGAPGTARSFRPPPLNRPPWASGMPSTKAGSA